MKFIIRLHAEITIKSKSVRKRHGKVLVNNLKLLLRDLPETPKVRWLWDRIEITFAAGLRSQALHDQVVDELQRIPGIAWFSESIEQPLTNFDAILAAVLEEWQHQLANLSFAVRVKRKGTHEFRSSDLERFLGAGILQQVPSARVKLNQPQQEVRIEIDGPTVRVFGHKQPGLGGFPIPTQETVVSLLSGGFDSSVASYQLIRRGARTHFCFFNLGGAQHETGVRQTAYYLWQQYSRSHPLKFVSIDFAPVVEDILTNVDNGQMGVILKRQMLRAADHVAAYLGASALVTGEAMGQVSSQTLSNLQVIDQATERLVLRPLITMDKQDIINISRQIGTEDIAKSMPEYCGVISNKPTVKAVPEKILEEEAKLNPNLLDQVVRSCRILDMQTIAEETAAQVAEVTTTAEVGAGATVIDIRSSEEQERQPLELAVPVLHIPFFRLAQKFTELDPQQQYLLYCDKGVMSKIQALYLQELGHQNVAVYTRDTRRAE
ncbi:MAG: tRNA uracil 4-sulfurtransferase ThiI [Idiomarina sp.]